MTKPVLLKGLKTIKLLIILFLIYTLTGGIFIYYIKPATPGDVNIENFYGNSSHKAGKVSIVDDRKDALRYRLKQIHDAEKTIDIAYYSIKDGITPRAVMGALTDAANRGVKVRILVDGVFHGFKNDFKNFRNICQENRNMELRFFEPINLLEPWKYNNRLHDKFILVDGKNYLIGGRNIEDRFLLENYTMKKQVRDRDIYVEDGQDGGSAHRMEEYFNMLWNSIYSKIRPLKYENSSEKRKTRILENDLLSKYNLYANKLKINETNLLENSTEVRKISVVSNPMGRMNKSPVILNTLGALANNCSDIKCQSPYIDTCFMINMFIKKYNIDKSNVTAYTNFLRSSPNPCALAGYLVTRTRLLDTGMNIYEYDGPDSIHGKSFIFDNKISVVGSFNMDNRSSFLSTETVVIIDSEEFSKKLDNSMKEIGRKSTLAQKKYRITPKAVFYAILGIILYPFRIML